MRYDGYEKAWKESATQGCGLNDDNIRTAVGAWLADKSDAETAYGHISKWDVSKVTRGDELFKDATNFDDDISNWDTSNFVSV